MQGAYNITDHVWEYLKQQDTAAARRILWKLDYDIASFISYHGEILIEPVTSTSIIPKYIYTYIRSHEQKILDYVRSLNDY